MLIVVTGKTGVGKTSILNDSSLSNIYFSDDFVKNHLYKTNAKLTNRIKRSFGDVTSNGLIDTTKLGKIVLTNEDKLKKLSKMVRPYVKKWLKSLPNNSVVEMASYVNYENWYKRYFDKVILITSIKPSLSGKFDYLDSKIQPIKDKAIKFDYQIENNSSLSVASDKLRYIVEEMRRR